MNSPLTGAWELVSGGRNSFMVFTDEHFNVYQDPENQQQTEPVGSYASEFAPTVRGLGGTYSVDGSTAALRYPTPPPDLTNGDLKVEFEVAGDELKIRGPQPDGSILAQSIWRRVG